MKRIISIRKSAFLTLCYLQTINPAPQRVTAEKSEDIGILLKISIQNNVGKEISSATIATAGAGVVTGDLTFDFEKGPNSIHVYNDSCVTKNKQEIGRLAVTRKQAPQGSTIVVRGTTSNISISLKKPDKALVTDNTDEKATSATMPSSLLEQIRADKELKSTETSAPIAPPLILEPAPTEHVKITLPADRAESRKERRRKKQQNKNMQTNPVTAVVETETNTVPEAPEAPPFMQEPTAPVAPDAPPFISDTTPAPTSNGPASDSSRQALLDQIRAGKQPKTTPTRSTPVVSAQTETVQQPSSRDDFLKSIQGGTKLRKTIPQESTESVATPNRTGSGGIISDELMKKLADRRKDVEQEMEDDADDEEWD